MGKRRKKRKHRGLYGGFVAGGTPNKWDSIKDGGLMVVTAVVAGGLGAAVGKHSLLAGIPITMLGVYKKNKYVTAAGLGVCLGSGFPRSGGNATNGLDDEMEGFDMAQVKQRVGNYFKNFSEKLYMPKRQEVEGLNGEDQPTYFLNPYSSLQGDELDLSRIDKVQEQIAQMNAMGEVECEF